VRRGVEALAGAAWCSVRGGGVAVLHRLRSQRDSRTHRARATRVGPSWRRGRAAAAGHRQGPRTAAAQVGAASPPNRGTMRGAARPLSPGTIHRGPVAAAGRGADCGGRGAPGRALPQRRPRPTDIPAAGCRHHHDGGGEGTADTAIEQLLAATPNANTAITSTGVSLEPFGRVFGVI